MKVVGILDSLIKCNGLKEVILNDENWQPEFGGELVIYKPEEDIKIYPLKGRVVIFESQILEHEVKPVHRKRFSITGWLKTS